MTASVSLPFARYKTLESVNNFYQKLDRRLAALPGVSHQGAGSDLPWTGYDENAGGFQIEGLTLPPGQDPHARYHMAGPGYFEALGTPLVRGRFFNAHDNATSAKALIINKAMAMRYWKTADVTGRRVTFEGQTQRE